VIKETSRKSKQ